MMPAQPSYDAVIVDIFARHYRKGTERFGFSRQEIQDAARRLGVSVPKNLGDLIYSFRFRKELPAAISGTTPKGKQWVIELAGAGRYRFRLATETRIVPRPDLLAVKVPDSTPEIVDRYALGDEQALLARVRYNRLIDIFLGLTTYSLQNHLRTTVAGMGQVEVDELYVGVNKQGAQYVIPVQAKGPRDRIGAVQTVQDAACCAEKFPALVCRPVAAQLLKNGPIALFELTVQGDEVRVIDERHYELVSAEKITESELALYRRAGAPRG